MLNILPWIFEIVNRKCRREKISCKLMTFDFQSNFFLLGLLLFIGRTTRSLFNGKKKRMLLIDFLLFGKKLWIVFINCIFQEINLKQLRNSPQMARFINIIIIRNQYTCQWMKKHKLLPSQKFLMIIDSPKPRRMPINPQSLSHLTFLLRQFFGGHCCFYLVVLIYDWHNASHKWPCHELECHFVIWFLFCCHKFSTTNNDFIMPPYVSIFAQI